jgi:hypothetical protein
MSQVLNVSLDYTHLMELARKAHSAFSRAKNKKAYLALSIWINDQPDEYGNDVKVTMNSSQQSSKSEGSVYVGNGRTSDAKKARAKKGDNADTGSAPVDDLPF